MRKNAFINKVDVYTYGNKLTIILEFQYSDNEYQNFPIYLYSPETFYKKLSFLLNSLEIDSLSQIKEIPVTVELNDDINPTVKAIYHFLTNTCIFNSPAE